MNKFIIAGTALLSLTACAVDKTRETTLPPLPTTGIQSAETLPVTDAGYSRTEMAFFDDLIYFYNGTPDIEYTDMLNFGNLWCDLMKGGMTGPDVVGRINEGAIDEADRRVHFAVVLAGITDLCPSEQGEFQYINDNFPQG